MRLETFPLILGAVIGLIGFALLFDAWAPDKLFASGERRRSPRRERDRRGEALVGLGVIAMAAAFIGRDSWRYSIVTVMVGSALLLWGVKRNGGYLSDVFVHKDRKTPPKSPPKSPPEIIEGTRRIR